MSVRPIVLAATFALILAGCSIGKPIPQATTYLVDAPAEAPAPIQPRVAVTLRMGMVRVAAAYAGSALVYRLDDVRYASDPYHAFIADPGTMFGSRMAEWLDRNGPFSAVASSGSGQPAPYVLEATVEELYGDFRPGTVPAAVLCVQFVLIDATGARPKVTYERTIAARVRLPRAAPDALVRGYGTALGEILSQVVPDLGARVAH